MTDKHKIKYPSVRTDIPAADYHANEAISKHGLDDVNYAPSLYKHNRENPPDPTPAMRFGSLYHMAILEPDRFSSETICEPQDAPRRPSITQKNAKNPSEDTRRAVEFWAAWDREAAGKLIVTAEEQQKLNDMQAALYADPVCKRTLADIILIEPSLFWLDPVEGVQCRARPDAIRRDNIFLDPKTCEDARKSAFEKTCFNQRYHVQAFSYSEAWAIINGEKAPPFAFIAQEKSPPYLCAVHIATPAMIEAGRITYRRDIARYAECLRRNEWPGIYDQPQEINLPGWAMKEMGLA